MNFNKKNINIFYLFILLSHLCGCYISCKQNGLVKRQRLPIEAGEYEEYYVKGGVKHGPYKLYGKKNFLIQEGEYKEGKMHGKWKTYFEGIDGWIEAIYNEGMPTILNSYHSNGQLEISIEKKGKKQDWNIIKGTYIANGDSLFPGTLKDGDGTLIRYDKNGDVLKIYEYKNGYVIGGTNMDVSDDAMIQLNKEHYFKEGH